MQHMAASQGIRGLSLLLTMYHTDHAGLDLGHHERSRISIVWLYICLLAILCQSGNVPGISTAERMDLEESIPGQELLASFAFSHVRAASIDVLAFDDC